MLKLSAIENELSRHGRFNLIDWLLSENYLSYSDYESWRYAKIDSLDGCLPFTAEKLNRLLDTAERDAKSLHLTAEKVDYYAWSDQRQLLCASVSPHRHDALVTRWQRTEEVPQLDLFMDNASLIAENEVVGALAERHWDSTSEALQRLTQQNPDHKQLGTYTDLLNYGRHMQQNPELPKESLAVELDGLKQEVAPLAKELLGANARDYLAFAWRRLSLGLAEIPFDPQQPELHLTFALEQIPDWSALEQELVGHQQLHDHPELIHRLIKSYQATAQYPKANALWCLLFDSFPEQAEAFIEINPKLSINTLWDDFWEFAPDWDVALFASFVLISEPGLLHHLVNLPSLTHEVNLAVLVLLQARQAGNSETEARRKLQQLSAPMMSCYLSR